MMLLQLWCIYLQYTSQLLVSLFIVVFDSIILLQQERDVSILQEDWDVSILQEAIKDWCLSSFRMENMGYGIEREIWLTAENKHGMASRSIKLRKHRFQYTVETGSQIDQLSLFYISSILFCYEEFRQCNVQVCTMQYTW